MYAYQKSALIILLSLLFSLDTLFCQEINSNPSENDTVKALNPYNVLIKSALVPGIGQIEEERLWEAAFFYGFSLTYYYRAIYHFSRYQKTNNRAPLYKARSDLSIAVFTHLLNILDVYDSAFNEKATGWQSTLFSDKPLKSPWGASLRSAFFPGWGQFYNESYIKAVLYFGLVSVVGYQVNWFAQKYRETGLEKYRDNRLRYSWYLGLSYLLMLTDAHVDAYLYKFDKAVKLTVIPEPYTKSLMLGLQIRF